MRTILLSALAMLLFSCSSELSKPKALEILTTLPEFRAPFYAPFHVGNEVLGGDDHQNSSKYIQEHLGKLIDAGLIQARVTDKNSWRSVINLELTPAGKEMSDPKRASATVEYVRACRVTPTEIVSMETVVPEKEIKVEFRFTQSEVTPFGEHLDFENGKTFTDTRTFDKKGWSWQVR